MATPQTAVELLQELIRIPSVNPEGDPGTEHTGELAIAEWLAGWLWREFPAARVELREVLPRRPNVVARFADGLGKKPRLLFAPHTVLRIYIDPEAPANAAMVGHAVQFLAIAAAFQLFDGVQAVLAGSLRGLQDTRMPMVLALLGYWAVGFATSVWLGLFTPLAGSGVWAGLAAGLVVVSVLLGWRWWRRARLGLLPT